MLWKRKKSLVASLGKYDGCDSNSSATHAIWPRQFQKSELVRCGGGRTLFSLPNRAVSLSISHRIGPIIHCSTALRSCILSRKSL